MKRLASGWPSLNGRFESLMALGLIPLRFQPMKQNFIQTVAWFGNESSVRAMKRSLIIHGSWALAVIAAFSLGGRSNGPSKEEQADLSAASAVSRSATSPSETGADGRGGRSTGRANEEREASRLEGLFGKVVSGSKSLELLVEQALRDPNPITRRLAFSRLLESLTPENAEAIRAQMVSLGAGGDQWRDFHYSWGAVSGKVALDFAMKSEEQDLAATMSGWAAANPADAMALLNNLPPEMQGQRQELTDSIVTGLAHTDPALATDLVLRLGREGNERADDLMEMIAGEALRTQGPELASQWAEGLPDGPLKGNAMGEIAESFARQNPQAAARWAQRFADKDYGAGAIEQIGAQWGESDPVAAVGWLEQLPEGPGQKSGLRNVFGDWEDSDPAAAGEYLLAMPQSAKRDSAISGFAMGYAWQNPQLAIAWAQDIQDPGLRLTSLTRAGQAYFRRDPNAAQAWLETSGLPAEAQQQVLNNRR